MERKVQNNNQFEPLLVGIMGIIQADITHLFISH